MSEFGILTVGMRIGSVEVIADLSADWQPVNFDDTDPSTWAYCWHVKSGLDYWLIRYKAMVEGNDCEIIFSDSEANDDGDVCPGFYTPFEAMRWIDHISAKPTPLKEKKGATPSKRAVHRDLDRELNSIPGVQARKGEQTPSVSMYEISFVDVSAGPRFVVCIHKRNRAVSFKSASSLMSWHVNFEHLPRLAIVVTAIRAWLEEQEISEILAG